MPIESHFGLPAFSAAALRHELRNMPDEQLAREILKRHEGEPPGAQNDRTDTLIWRFNEHHCTSDEPGSAAATFAHALKNGKLPATRREPAARALLAVAAEDAHPIKGYHRETIVLAVVDALTGDLRSLTPQAHREISGRIRPFTEPSKRQDWEDKDAFMKTVWQLERAAEYRLATAEADRSAPNAEAAVDEAKWEANGAKIDAGCADIQDAAERRAYGQGLDALRLARLQEVMDSLTISMARQRRELGQS